MGAEYTVRTCRRSFLHAERIKSGELAATGTQPTSDAIRRGYARERHAEAAGQPGPYQGGKWQAGMTPGYSSGRRRGKFREKGTGVSATPGKKLEGFFPGGL